VIESGLVASRFLHYLAAFVLFGVAVFPDHALDTRVPLHRAAAKRASYLIVPCAIAALATAILWFQFTTAGMAGDLAALADPERLTLVAGTSFGRVWTFRLALAAALVLAAFRRRAPPWHAALVLGSGVLVASIARTGHAIEGEGAAALIHSVSDALHLLAGAIWMGALTALVMIANAAGREPNLAGALAHALARFSAIGPWVVGILALTGLVNSWVLIGPAHVGALATSRYGTVLMAKVMLFVVMLAFAAAHRLALAPGLKAALGAAGAKPKLRQLRATLAIETGLGAAVLAAAAWLGTLPFPAGL
jgi:copper resistance protein D